MISKQLCHSLPGNHGRSRSVVQSPLRVGTADNGLQLLLSPHCSFMGHFYLPFLPFSLFSLPSLLVSLFPSFMPPLFNYLQKAGNWLPSQPVGLGLWRGISKSRSRSRNPPESACTDERKIQRGGPCKMIKGARNGQYFSPIIFPFSLRLQAMRIDEE